MVCKLVNCSMFQHTAARRRLAKFLNNLIQAQSFNTQPREGGWKLGFDVDPNFNYVSTHSRAKAAGLEQAKAQVDGVQFQHTAARRRLVAVCSNNGIRSCFNTQPREGGWI